MVGLPADHKGTGQAGADIGHTQADQVGIRIEAFVVTRGIGARGRRTLRQYDHEHRKRGGDQLEDQFHAPLDVRQPEVRQTAGDVTQHVHVLAEVDRPADDDGADNGNQAARNLVRDLLRADQDHQHRERGGQRSNS